MKLLASAKTFLISYRHMVLACVHIALWSFSFFAAFLLRFDFELPQYLIPKIVFCLPILLVFRLFFSFVFKIFYGMWKHTSMRDLNLLLMSTSASSFSFSLFLFLSGEIHDFPRSILIIDWFTAIFLTGGLRFCVRAWGEMRFSLISQIKTQRVLIVGAGNAGAALLRALLRENPRRYQSVGFVDDDLHKKACSIHGVQVYGPISNILEIGRRLKAQEVIVALPSVSGNTLRRIYQLCNSLKLPVKIFPGLEKLIDGRMEHQSLRDIEINDLLQRSPVTLEAHSISEFLKGRSVVVTGAGGSIGSGLCESIAEYAPAQLILLEQSENVLFDVHRLLLAQYPQLQFIPYIGNVCDQGRMEHVFKHFQPSIVFHAAAHKHVPMMEWNPSEAVRNNILGTRNMADLALKYKVDRFVMVSTDKAVNPTSVMGVSKRVSELYVQALSKKSSCSFITVRFGNVLGSRGSVLPIFQEQIAKGGPVTVTHPEMTRYFMTIPEACQLVLEAASIGHGGEIFILDMGKPVKIVQLARDLILLSGFEPDKEIPIVFTGMRPGEKLFEELSLSEEESKKTRHPKIFIGKHSECSLSWINSEIAFLSEAMKLYSADRIKKIFWDIVPEYTPHFSDEALKLGLGLEKKKEEEKGPSFDVSASAIGDSMVPSSPSPYWTHRQGSA